MSRVVIAFVVLLIWAGGCVAVIMNASSFAAWFCRHGRNSLDATFIPQELVDAIYDESRAPAMLRFVAIMNLLSAVILFALIVALLWVSPDLFLLGDG